MACENFDDFVAQLTKRLAIEPPILAKDRNGLRSFSITHDGAGFTFSEHAPSEGSLSMFLRFGVPPKENTGQVLSNLLVASFMMASKGAAAFVQHPTTGAIFMHRMFLLDRLHVPGLQSVLGEFAKQVARWSTDPFLGTRHDVPTGQLNPVDRV